MKTPGLQSLGDRFELIELTCDKDFLIHNFTVFLVV